MIKNQWGEFCAPVIFRRISKMPKNRRGEFWTPSKFHIDRGRARNPYKTELRPTGTNNAPPPGRMLIISPHRGRRNNCHRPTCARQVGLNRPHNAPRKKKKIAKRPEVRRHGSGAKRKHRGCGGPDPDRRFAAANPDLRPPTSDLPQNTATTTFEFTFPGEPADYN
jgi:hypothetical protein